MDSSPTPHPFCQSLPVRELESCGNRFQRTRGFVEASDTWHRALGGPGSMAQDSSLGLGLAQRTQRQGKCERRAFNSR